MIHLGFGYSVTRHCLALFAVPADVDHLSIALLFQLTAGLPTNFVYKLFTSR
jgi:hypothetical protein